MTLEQLVDTTPLCVDSLESLVEAASPQEVRGYSHCERVARLTPDSRRVVPGTVFVAVRGVAVDGHKYVAAAIAAGACAVVVEEWPSEIPDGVLAVKVADTRVALGLMASRIYGDPSEELRLVGVTGTNGKTTIATLLYDMMRMRGLRAGLLSTVAVKIDGSEYEADHTTPDPITLNACLRAMVNAGCSFAAMEVSSHAADQHRIAGLCFAGGIFTNITLDNLPADAFALTNADDRNGAVMLQNTPARTKAFYSVRDMADVCLHVVEDRLDGMLVEVGGREVETMFVGRFNASNLAAVSGAALMLGIASDEALVLLSRLRPVAGRFQPVRSERGVTAIVDYAHTPDALVNVLDTIAEVRPEGASIITVCGCGGDRDRGKRPQMARAAAERSDVLVLTSDNPRSEEPQAIIDDMIAGLDEWQRGRTHCFVDRREAIVAAVKMAGPGDIILIAGKGHENTQVLADGAVHFDDREEVARALGVM